VIKEICMRIKLLAIPAIVIVCACTIVQTVEPTDLSPSAELCIIENTTVREGFLKEMEAVLGEMNIRYQVTDVTTAQTRCAWTMTYVANWSWDLALYLAYADIRVYKNGLLDGEAIYDASGGSGNPGKFIDAETKIRELLNQLF